MQKILIFVIAYIIFNIACSAAYAGIDREINESKKCSRIFSYFEKQYRLPKDILHSIALRESGKPHSKYNIGIVWPWTINVEGKGFYFNTKYEALKFTKAQIDAGKTSIDIGCMQINLKHHPRAFTSLHHAFSPTGNIHYAAKLLKSHYDKHGSWEKAIGNYHSATADKALDYHLKVSRISSGMAAYKQSLDSYFYTKLDAKNIYQASIPSKKNTRKLSHDNVMPSGKQSNASSGGININKIKTNNLFRRIQ